MRCGHYLSFDYVPAPQSIYKGINKLPAAHKLTTGERRDKDDRYWSLSFKKPDETPSIKEAAEHLRELLSDAVRMRLVADVPLGILLSGGVDSSTVAAFAVQHATETVKTFSIGFEEDSFDESKLCARSFTPSRHRALRRPLKRRHRGELISEIGTMAG